MIEHVFCVRVPYSDTDVMGFLHHSNYVRYYETARWELFREFVIPYVEIEESGFLLPVIGINLKYIRAAGYDDFLTIKTRLKAVEGARIRFMYKMYNQENILINKAEVDLAIIDKETKKICDMPDFMKEAFLKVLVTV